METQTSTTDEKQTQNMTCGRCDAPADLETPCSNGCDEAPKQNLGNTGYVAVDGSVSTAGCITWWRLSGATDVAALQGALTDEGVPEEHLPREMTRAAALRQAMNEVSGPHRLVRPLRGKGWALVDEVLLDGQLSYSTVFTVELVPDGLSSLDQLRFTWPGDVVTTHSEGVVRAAYSDLVEKLNQGATGAWLSDLVRRYTNAVALRDTGGIYFVPSTHVERWQQVSRALATSGAHVVYDVPSLRTDSAVEAILAAVEQEAQTLAEQLSADVDNAALGQRALTTREAACRAAREKVAAYEGLLGRGLDAMQQRLVALESAIVARRLAAEAEAAE